MCGNLSGKVGGSRGAKDGAFIGSARRPAVPSGGICLSFVILKYFGLATRYVLHGTVNAGYG